METDEKLVALNRIAVALEAMVQPQEDTTKLKLEIEATKATVNAMRLNLKYIGEEITEIMDNEFIDLMEKHRRIRKIGADLNSD